MAYIISGSVHFTQVNEEVVILDEASDGYLALNEVGAVIWEAIVDGLGDDDIAGRVVQQYEVDAIQAAADVAEFLEVLVGRGLVAAA